MASLEGVALVFAVATDGVAGIGGVVGSFVENADSNKESSCEVMLAATLSAANFLSVEAGIASAVRSSGINDSTAIVSRSSEGEGSDSGVDSAAVRFSIESAEASLSSAIVFFTVVACVPGGSTRSIKFDSGNGLIGDSISSPSEENSASGSKNWKAVTVSVVDVAESRRAVACHSNMGNLGTIMISAK